MLAADVGALHDVLRFICEKSNLSMLTQPAVQAVLDGILDEARIVLADVAYQWNRSRAIHQLPPEILAACFSFLPFHCRLSVSRVSRAWRRACIQTPSLWADITDNLDVPCLTAPLMQRALRRAGKLPIHFESRHAVDCDIVQLIRDSMHRMEFIGMREVKNIPFLEQSAPLLHTLHLRQSVRLTGDFLAGSPGRLRTLRARELHIPATCPALANLTTLSISACGDRTLQDIFRICPLLQSLSLTSLFWTNATVPGTGG